MLLHLSSVECNHSTSRCGLAENDQDTTGPGETASQTVDISLKCSDEQAAATTSMERARSTVIQPIGPNM